MPTKTELLHSFLVTLQGIFLASLLFYSLLPYYFLIHVVWQHTHNLILCLLAGCVSYVFYPTTLMLVVVIFKRLLFIRIQEGTYKIGSFGGYLWAFVNSLVTFVRFAGNLELFRVTPLLNLYYKGMGAKIGRDVIINSVIVYDPDLLEIGDNVVIGGDVVLMAHSGEGKYLHIRKVKIGNGASIGQSSTILCGAEIGEGAIVGAMSLVPKDFKVPPNSVYGGVPVREISRKNTETQS